MSNETVSSGLTAFANIAIAEARNGIYNSMNLSKLVTWKDVQAGQVSARFPKFGALTASALTEGSTADNQVFGASSVTLTPTTNAVASTVVTDVADFINNNQTAVDFGRTAKDAIIKKWNSDIFDLFVGLDNRFGYSGLAINEGIIRQAATTLLNYTEELPYLVCTPEVLETVWGLYSLSTNNTSDVLKQAVYEGSAPVIYGARVVVVNGQTADESGDIWCGLISPKAIGMAVQWDIQIESARKPASVGFEITASSSYAVGEIDGSMGCGLLVKNSNPTYDYTYAG